MFGSALIALAAAIGPALGLPSTPKDTQLDPRQTGSIYWSASGYQVGCSPGGCGEAFNLTATEAYIPQAPGFNVRCNNYVTNDGSWLKCSALDTASGSAGDIYSSAWSVYHNDTGLEVWLDLYVSHKYTTSGLTFNNTAYGQVLLFGSTKEFQMELISTEIIY